MVDFKEEDMTAPIIEWIKENWPKAKVYVEIEDAPGMGRPDIVVKHDGIIEIFEMKKTVNDKLLIQCEKNKHRCARVWMVVPMTFDSKGKKRPITKNEIYMKFIKENGIGCIEINMKGYMEEESRWSNRDQDYRVYKEKNTLDIARHIKIPFSPKTNKRYKKCEKVMEAWKYALQPEMMYEKGNKAGHSGSRITVTQLIYYRVMKQMCKLRKYREYERNHYKEHMIESNHTLISNPAIVYEIKNLCADPERRIKTVIQQNRKMFQSKTVDGNQYWILRDGINVEDEQYWWNKDLPKRERWS